MPPSHLLDQIQDIGIKTFLTDCNKRTKKISFEELFPGIEKDAADLMRKLLAYDPKERISAAEALRHPYFKDLHSEENE